MAVKVLHEDLSTDAELAARSRDEARLMSQLNHDNIVRIYGLTRVAGRSAVLMEYVQGIDCEALIKQARAEGGGLPLRAASRIIECSADALWAAFSGAPSRQGHYVWSRLRKYQRFRAAVRILTDRLNPYLLRLFFISSVTRALGALGVWSVRFMVTVGVVVTWCFVFNVAVVTIALFCPVLR